jgi:tricarballylate dehydrogenase
MTVNENRHSMNISAGPKDKATCAEADFYDDMGRITQYRTDPTLCEILVTKSRETLMWMRDQGIRFMPDFGRQAYKIDGSFNFWGGATVAVSSGGPGLVDGLYKAAEKRGVTLRYQAWVRELIPSDQRPSRCARSTTRSAPTG